MSIGLLVLSLLLMWVSGFVAGVGFVWKEANKLRVGK